MTDTTTSQAGPSPSAEQAFQQALQQTLQRGVSHHQAGQMQEAEHLYRAILQAEPQHPVANHNLGILMLEKQQPAAGLPHFEAALAAKPESQRYWLSYIDALVQAGQTELAQPMLAFGRQHGLEGDKVEVLAEKLKVAQQATERSGAEQKRSVEATPAEAAKTVANNGKSAKKGKSSPTMPRFPKSLPQGKRNQLVALFNAGRYVELESRARLLAAQHPDSGSVWKALGLSLQMQGKDALPALQKTTELLPGDAEAHNNLGNALQAFGQPDGAMASYRRALDIKSDFAVAHYNLGVTLQALGQLDDAVASYRRALEIRSEYAEAYSNLGVALQGLGQLVDAAATYRRALEIKPDYADAHSNLGAALQALGQLDDALASYCRALEINPGYAEAHSNLGNTLRDLGRFDDAVASHRRALEIKPDYAEAHSNLGNTLRDLGRLDDAVASYLRALEIKPDYADAHSNALFLYGYYALIDPLEYLVLARNWEQACLPAQDRQVARHRVFERAPLPGRRLRVGYVSGDYRQHSVSFFVQHLFTHHDRARIELFAYSTQGQRDAVTERLQALAEHWVPLVGIPDAAIRERIEADGIDVLIDLSGHTTHNRLGAIARRAAPVQAHYLGYFASTGLTEMDYWIGDEILTPAGTDSHFSEQVWRLPRVWVSYDGKADAPVPDWRPSEDGTIWLGSFNNLGKLTPATLALWAKVLDALPEGKLLLKTKELRDKGNRQHILETMTGHGILPERIDLQHSYATPDWSAHMAYYNRLDIALDPVGGIGGGTTTCDALWMGAPVIAREGDRMASRMTASMLDAIGRPEWIARSEAEYIDKVVALARDVDQRKALRSSQRNRMASSPLCDARGLAMSLENAYFEMFERWLDDKI